MIRVEGLTLRRGARRLLHEANFVVHAGERVGLVGANGAGKSTLFAALQHRLDADAGQIDWPQSWRLSSISQDIPDQQRAALDFVIDGDTPLRQLQAQREALGSEPDRYPLGSEAWGLALAEVEAKLNEAGQFSAQARAEQLLDGLGFGPEDFVRPVLEFSGGWQMRLNLARALMAPSDLLLLDEPTNHLDLEAMLWLERWLASYEGTVILISHDTEFLDGVCNVILHLEHERITRYRGNYASFESQRAEKLRQLEAAHARQARTVAHLQQFISRFKAKASKAKQAQSRVKALERMETLEPLRAARQLDLELPEPAAMPDPLLELDRVDAGYPGHTVLHGLRNFVRAGARIGVLGVNGAGKSTFVRTLVGDLTPMAGTVRAARGTVVGYFAQHQLDLLDGNTNGLVNLARVTGPTVAEQTLRDHLGRFGFSGDAVLTPVGQLSGGEKARMALALIVWHRPNLLVLDEPSNHLDIDTREALTEALLSYEGALLMVSHDRHLLRNTVDTFWIVADGQLQEFAGDLDDYRQQTLEKRRAASAPCIGGLHTAANENNSSGLDGVAATRKAQKREEAEQRQARAVARKPIQRELEQIEKKMQNLQSRRESLDALLADPTHYQQSEAARNTVREHAEVLQALEPLELRWLELQEALEAIDQASRT